MNIRLGVHPGCIDEGDCTPFATERHRQLASGRYDHPASTLLLDDIDAYLAQHRTARKRAQRARNLSYTFKPIDRAAHSDDIYRINTSAPKRQGRPMSAGYLERHEFSPLPDYPCRRHRIDTYGVFSPGGHLVAYIVLYVCGELALVSQILGHAAHLAADVMYLLAVETFRATLERSGPVTAFYNMHDSGTDGLRYFKERLGFAPARVAWSL